MVVGKSVEIHYSTIHGIWNRVHGRVDRKISNSFQKSVREGLWHSIEGRIDLNYGNR